MVISAAGLVLLLFGKFRSQDPLFILFHLFPLFPLFPHVFKTWFQVLCGFIFKLLLCFKTTFKTFL